MIPDFFQYPDPIFNFGVGKTVIGFSLVLFATFVGIEIRLGNDDDES